MSAYHALLPPFDRLSVQTKSMLGALLDYAGVDRAAFANAWQAEPEQGGKNAASPQEMTEESTRNQSQQPTLFSGQE